MSKKRTTTTEAFIECPFDEEDIFSQNDFETLLNNTSVSTKSKTSSENKSSNLFYFQSIFNRI